MKLIHLSDLHIGKRVNEFSMLEDQEYILKEIIGMISREEPDGVIIAGDVYDKPVPPAGGGAAVRLVSDAAGGHGTAGVCDQRQPRQPGAPVLWGKVDEQQEGVCGAGVRWEGEPGGAE